MTPRVLDRNTVIINTEKLLRRAIGEEVELATARHPRLGAVHADPGQVEQVLLNLAVNARDAMPHGGRLTIETRNVFLDEAYASRHVAVRPGPHALLSVSDNGSGMSADALPRVFEPFLMTKEQG